MSRGTVRACIAWECAHANVRPETLRIPLGEVTRKSLVDADLDCAVPPSATTDTVEGIVGMLVDLKRNRRELP